MPARYRVPVLLTCLFLCLLANPAESRAASVAVTPASASLAAGQSMWFSASVTGVSWSITPALGTISNGYYTAPTVINGTQTITITATSLSNATVSGSAVLSLTGASGSAGSLQMIPSTATLSPGQSAQFALNIPRSPNVYWSMVPNIGSVLNGLYTAPSSISAQTTVTLMATDFDLNATASASIVLLPSSAPQPSPLSLTPATASLGAGQSATFSASGSSAGVSWALSPAVGTISNGVYTAPSSISTSQTVTLTATSLSNASQSASAIISLVASPLTIQLSPSSATLTPGQTAQFTPTLSNGQSASVSWSLVPNVGSVANGLYTAPASVTTQTTVTLVATNLSSPSNTASATITVQPKASQSGSISLTPTSAALGAGQAIWLSATVTGLCSAGICFSGVSWGLTPPVGTLSNGFYTAPTTISAPQTVTVTATSLGNPALSASAAISLVANNGISSTPLQLSPTSATLSAGQSTQFTLSGNNRSVASGNSGVSWSVVPNIGSVTNGLYTAPASVTAQTSVTVIATSVTSPNNTASASIALQPNPIVVSVSPSAASLNRGQSTQFSALVNGATSSAVAWSLTPAIGSITNGVYTAPSTLSTQQTVTVTATSLADATKSASATVTLAPITISIVPSSISLSGGASSQFTATVGGTLNTGLTWSMSPTVGTVLNGLYTAPASISAAQTVSLTATSLADPTQTATATISLTPNVPLSLSVSPTQASLAASQTQQFAVNSNVSSGLGGAGLPSVQWSIVPAIGSITQTGLYTAPSSITTQQTVTIVATGSSASAQASVTLTPSQQPPSQPTSIQLPVEVMGAAGTRVPVSFNIPAGANLSGQMQLWLQIHGVKYETQASVQINGGAWIPINSSTVTIQGYAAKLGGIGGGFTTLKVTINVPAGSFTQGQNTLTFQFIGTNGVSSGYRVLNLNVLASDGTQLIPQSSFTLDDPTTWQPPSSNSADIQAGQALWTSGSLTAPGVGAIQATCSGCHTQDGADLKYFNYSNYSIQVRSVFHGLTAQQGNQIASYIRSLNVAPSATGRPWNPPYQPGPGMDSQPVYEWAAGAGLGEVLDDDTDMLAYTMPNGNTANWAYNGYMNPRETPVPYQMPDWNSWLPTVHPMDGWGSTFTNSSLYTEYLNLRSQLQPNNATTYANMAGDLRLWLNRWEALGVTPAQTDPSWNDPNFVAKIHSLGLWSMVKLWEFNHEDGLEGLPTAAFGPTGTNRAWYTDMAFYTSPHMQGIPNPSPGIGNGLAVTETYTTFIWYQVQLVLNDGNGQGSTSWPIDWAYSVSYLINDLTWDNLANTPRMGTGGMMSLWAVKALQTVTDGTGGPSWLVGFPAQISTWSEMSSSQKDQVMNALVAAWFTRFSPMNAQQLFASGMASASSLNVSNPGTGPWGLIYALPELAYQGVNPNLLTQITTWLYSIWPTFNWTANLNESCAVYNYGQIICGL
jgi:hypothetical protein